MPTTQPGRTRRPLDPILAAYRRLGDKTAVARELGVARSTVIKRVTEAEAGDRRAKARARPRDRWPLAPRLRTLIMARFPTLSHAALACGMSQPFLWRIAHGQPPRPATLDKILAGLGATFDDLLRAVPDTEADDAPTPDPAAIVERVEQFLRERLAGSSAAPRLADIASHCEISQSAAFKAILDLETRGVLRRSGRWGQTLEFTGGLEPDA